MEWWSGGVMESQYSNTPLLHYSVLWIAYGPARSEPGSSLRIFGTGMRVQ